MTSAADPGYGDPNAPVGSPDWAKRWRLVFQTAVKELPSAPSQNARYYLQGKQHRAWTLVADDRGRPFPTWDDFCAYRQPWGLGTDPAEFRRFVVPALGENGEREFDLMTVAPGTDVGGRPRKGEETADIVSAVSDATKRKSERLRAILRAPEIVQELYRDGLITQTVAARMGPKSPSPELAARIAEARQEIEALDRSLPRSEFRKAVAGAVSRRLGARGPTALDLLRRAWAKATEADRQQFLSEVG